MRYFYTLLLLLTLGLGRVAYAQQPFLKYGVKVKVATLSNGRFQEFFTNDSLRRIGSVVYDTRLHRVAYLLPPDSLIGHAKPDITSRWMSPDPLSEKEMYSSPYVFVNDNPVNKFDPDGRSGIASIDRKHHTITVSSTMIFYGPSASAQVARSSAADVQNAWNGAHGHVKIGGVSYSVRFKVAGVYRQDLSEKEVNANKNYENNYIKVQETNVTAKPLPNVSEMDAVGSNTGTFLTRHIKKDGSSTEGHEMGHGWGEQHPPAGADNVIDLRGQGVPREMAPRGTYVDPQYQYDPNAAAGSVGGTMNPEARKVNQTDINELGLQNLQYGKDGRANVGTLTNQYHSLNF